MRNLFKPLFILFAIFLTALPALAEVKVIEADALYTMGDNVSRVDAGKIAVQEAERKALEQAVIFVSSLAEVKDFQLTKDEATACAAGVLDTEIVQQEMRGTADHPVIYVKTRSRIDTDVLLNQIGQCRDSEELREQLAASQKESEALMKERDRLVADLDSEKDKTKAGDARRKLNGVLAKEETNAEVLKLWAAFAGRADFSDSSPASEKLDPAEADKAVAALKRAVAASPGNVRARLLLAAVYELKHDPDGAEQALRAAVAAHPTNPLFHMRLGLLLNRREKHEEALKQFLAVERLRPRNTAVFYYIGTTYRDLGQCRQCAVNLKRFLPAAEGVNSPRFASMKREAADAIMDCEGKPRGPAGRQRVIRKPN